MLLKTLKNGGSVSAFPACVSLSVSVWLCLCHCMSLYLSVGLLLCASASVAVCRSVRACVHVSLYINHETAKVS